MNKLRISSGVLKKAKAKPAEKLTKAAPPTPAPPVTKPPAAPEPTPKVSPAPEKPAAPQRVSVQVNADRLEQVTRDAVTSISESTAQIVAAVQQAILMNEQGKPRKITLNVVRDDRGLITQIEVDQGEATH